MIKSKYPLLVLLELIVLTVLFSSLFISSLFLEEKKALALSINNVATSSVNSNAGEMDVKGSGSTSGSANNSNSGSAAGANSNTNASQNYSSSNSSGTASANTGLDVNVTLSPITIIRSQVIGQASDTPPDVVSVHTNSDISSYVTALVQSDENIERVVLHDDKVTVIYKEPIKLFGFIPLIVNANAEVTTNNKVSVHYPWYSFLAITHAKDLQSQLQARVTTELDADSTVGGTSADATFSFQTQARLVSAMKDVLHAYLVSQTGVSAKIENPRDI